MSTSAVANQWWLGAPITGVVPLTADNAVQRAGRAVRFTASAAGTVVVTMADATTDTLTLAVGDNIYPYAITMYASGGGATITNAANLY